MNLSGLLEALRQTKAYAGLRTAVLGNGRSLRVNLLDAARPPVLAALHADADTPLLVVAATPEKAIGLYRQLVVWTAAPLDVLHFAETETLPFERAPLSAEARHKRLSVLHRLSQPVGPRPLIVASARALMQQTLSPGRFRDCLQTLRRDESRPIDALLRGWQRAGYEPVSVIEARGQFAHRGGIVDVWSPQSEAPARLEFYGDELDSIRRFDLVSQRSREPLDSAEIIPASEAHPEFGPDAYRRLSRLVQSSTTHDAARSEMTEDLKALSESRRFHQIEYYLPYLESQQSTLLDHLVPGALLVADDWEAVQTAAAGWQQEVATLAVDAVARGDIPDGFAAPVVPLADTLRPTLDLTFGLMEPAHPDLEGSFAAAQRYGGKLLNAITDWQELIAHGERLVVVSRQAERIRELMAERGLAVTVADQVGATALTLMHGALPQGFVMSAEGATASVHLLSDAELFGYARPEPRRSSEKRAAPLESFYAELTIGDFVVHVEHGIARYAGLVRRDFGVEREYLQLEYAGGDKLFVPVDAADRVARYVGAGEHGPAVHRLGTADWETAKAKAQRAIEEIADELIALYAKRAQVRGHPFARDSTWQQELEDAFPYVETPDQLRAIAAIKRDMESERPMDRLVCGDVGYGKTEVALRAAFKAVMDGTQVAVLVPTTVLAEQHLKTFDERLRAFPVAVEMLSRFRTESQQKKILEALARGAVDIVIGTHRLLQADVAFKNLGLLIIDEEQRFGVKAKERLKQMRTEVDVLTLTATPIPRTLNMALSGARDMSTIDTPPDERLPIRTYVLQYDEAVVKQAILREMGRTGQVFFVHNRVVGIEQIAARLRRLVPEARIAVGHGQMAERALERVMLQFADGKFDVLVCTTIIESGIDLPNVNTIIVNRADQFGLADLYQLRGRVGRSARQSYAYLMHSRDKALVDIARRRLQAVFEASELGAGFKIAMRDLEIRGAGDILGARQHGHIAAIGFDLYTKLLAQAVRERQPGAPVAPVAKAPEEVTPVVRPSLTLDLPLPAHLPRNYVADEDLRLRLYRRIAELESSDAVDAFAQELGDRFGSIPEPTTNLLYLLRLKALGVEAGVDSIAADDDRILVRVRDRATLLLWQAPAGLNDVSVTRNLLAMPLAAGWKDRLLVALQALARVASLAPVA